VKVAYFVHDLLDPAVHRRVRMLSAGGATVTLVGFRRSPQPVERVEGVAPLDLGPTRDGRLAARAASVVGALVTARFADTLRGADVVLARNLEMLAIAVRARRRHAPLARLVYECLDIHRLLLSKSVAGTVLRSLETRLWRDVDLLLTSSPAFVRNYFVPRRFPAPIRLVENKVLAEEVATAAPTARRQAGPPWRIGWFGMIRCRKSLDVLGALARACDGDVEVIIRGRPSQASLPDLAAAVRDLPHVVYEGPYRNPDDLPAIYGDVHFAWAIDYFEEGQNSTWLLPNRIYEGPYFGAVPIALSAVETGRWLKERNVGVVLDKPIGPQLSRFFRELTPAGYEAMRTRIHALPRSDLAMDRAHCRELVRALSTTVLLPNPAGEPA
jgi:succinoglycan biosynthesis protein ExoL